MEAELRRALVDRVALLKFVHGYGSSGQGGDIRIALQNELMGLLHNKKIKAVIFGEDWRISNEQAWALLKKWPSLKQDSDLGRENRGITIVAL